MNILTDTLPDCAVIGGKSYPVHTDFRTWIKFMHMIENYTDIIELMTESIILCFKNKTELPPDFGAAFSGLVKFCAGSADGVKGGETSKKRIYDFEYDSELIYAAFYHDYGINLTTVHMHWYEFKALLTGLHKDNMFCEVMGYRAIELSTIKDKEQKEFYKKMKRRFKLPDMRTEEQKNADMIEELNNAML